MLLESSNELSTMKKSGGITPIGKQRGFNATRPLPAVPPRGGDASETRTPDARLPVEHGAPELQAESPNLSYSQEEGSGHSDDASSTRPFFIERCMLERVEPVTFDGSAGQDLAPPGPETAEVDLLTFLSELKPTDDHQRQVPGRLPTVHETPRGRPKTLKFLGATFARTEKQPSVTKASNTAKPPKLPKLGTQGLHLQRHTMTASPESTSSTSSSFLPISPRGSSTPGSTPRRDYFQQTPRTLEGATAESHSDSQGEKPVVPERKVQTPIVRPSGRRNLGKTQTRRDIPRTAAKPPLRTSPSVHQHSASPDDETKALTDAWHELGALADEMLAISAAGPVPLPMPATEDAGQQEKPPAIT